MNFGGYPGVWGSPGLRSHRYVHNWAQIRALNSLSRHKGCINSIGQARSKSRRFWEVLDHFGGVFGGFWGIWTSGLPGPQTLG